MADDRDIIPDGPKRGRQRCCVMGCGRTFKDEGHASIMCGTHWRLAPAFMRRRHARIRKRYRAKFGDYGWWHYPAGTPQRLEAWRLARLAHQAWELCAQAATIRAMGL